MKRAVASEFQYYWLFSINRVQVLKICDMTLKMVSTRHFQLLIQMPLKVRGSIWSKNNTSLDKSCMKCNSAQLFLDSDYEI